MDHIEMSAYNGRISITLRPSVAKWTKTRNIMPASALEIAALMLRSGTLPNSMTVFGDPEFACQVDGGDTRYAWLGIQAWGYKGDRDLVACVGGDLVKDIGQCLHQLYMELAHPDMVDGEFSIFNRRVCGFYLSGGKGEEDIIDLNSLDPLHP